MKLASAQRRGLADEAADRIREAIFAGDIELGSSLKEVELAEQLGVSRGSVREGLARLEKEGLIESEWHRGTRVRTLTKDDIDELYTLRIALEELVMRTAAEKASEDDLDRLDEIVAQMKHTKDPAQLLALDIRFHDTVYEISGHRRLRDAWHAIRSQIYVLLLMRIRTTKDYAGRVPKEHEDLAAVLRARKPARAAKLAKDHVTVAYDRLRPTS